MTAGRGVRSDAARRAWDWLRVALGALVLVVLALRVGTGPFRTGVRQVHAAALLAALAITALTTLASAWRWRLLAGALGQRLPVRTAVSAYYRSQLINSTLPGGIVGDVHRGVRQGEDTGDAMRALRSVGWDRAAGQLVQVALAGVVLLALDSPVLGVLAVVVGVSLAAVAAGVLVVVAVPRSGSSWPVRAATALRGDVRAALVHRRIGLPVVVLSALVVAGHVAVFVIAAESNGRVPLTRLLPIAMLVLLSMTLPTSVGGWGPREGVAAWAFMLSGLGADQGVSTATTYGILSLVAVLPGVVPLLMPRRRRPPAVTSTESPAPMLVGAGSGQAGRG